MCRVARVLKRIISKTKADNRRDNSINILRSGQSLDQGYPQRTTLKINFRSVQSQRSCPWNVPSIKSELNENRARLLVKDSARF